MNTEMQPTRGKESKHRQLPLTEMAYAAAVLFTVHLLTYFIPSIRDATPNGSPIVVATANRTGALVDFTVTL